MGLFQLRIFYIVLPPKMIVYVRVVACAEGHSKMAWFIVSSSAPHLGQWLSHRIWRCARLLVTTNYPEIVCQIKCFTFSGACIFLGVHHIPVENVPSYPGNWLNSVHPIHSIAPTIFVPLISLTYGQILNQGDIFRIDIVFKNLWIPSFWIPYH